MDWSRIYVCACGFAVGALVYTAAYNDEAHVHPPEYPAPIITVTYPTAASTGTVQLVVHADASLHLRS